MLNQLPGLRFSLFGFQVTIGLDFLLIVLLFGSGLPLEYLLAWTLVLAVSILVHELGHAFALRRYGINPVVRLWMMGGMTMSGFPLTPRKALIVSAAGPVVGISVGLLAMLIQPALGDYGLVGFVATNMVWVNLYWGAFNLLPIAALDGGNIATSAFLWAFGERGRTPAMLFVGLASIVVAIVALMIGFTYLAVIVVIFSVFNPAPYLTLWRMLTGGSRPGAARGSGSAGWRGGSAAAPRPESRPQPRHDAGPRPAVAVAVSARRQYGETYLATLGTRAGYADLGEIESAPAPLLSDVSAMVVRRDDAGLAARLMAETDPVASFGIVARLVDGNRVDKVLAELRRDTAAGSAREAALLKLQVGLHSLGKFQESIAAAGALGSAGDAASALLVARSGARIGDRKLTRQALERVVALRAATGDAPGTPFPGLTDTALGDIARLGADFKVAELLGQLRGVQAN